MGLLHFTSLHPVNLKSDESLDRFTKKH